MRLFRRPFRCVPVCLLAVATSLCVSPALDHPPLAQPSVGAFRILEEEQRFFFVAGYLEGFAVAAQAPSDRAPLLQKCFADWGTRRVLATFEQWIRANPDKAGNAAWSARMGLYSALAEACGWKQGQ